jgi:hypothetical protein
MGSGDLDFAAWPQVKTIHGRSKKSICQVNGDLARQKGDPQKVSKVMAGNRSKPEPWIEF